MNATSMPAPTFPFGRQVLLTVALALPLLVPSCATQTLPLAEVGPPPPVAHSTVGQGYLVVYSATQDIHLDRGIPYRPHTGYLVLRPNGKTVRWIPNRVGPMDLKPSLVDLPAGRYQVRAEAEDYGRVLVPVVIEPGRTTEVHLEGKGNWKPAGPALQETNWVRFPDGEFIGWRSLPEAKDASH